MTNLVRNKCDALFNTRPSMSTSHSRKVSHECQLPRPLESSLDRWITVVADRSRSRDRRVEWTPSQPFEPLRLSRKMKPLDSGSADGPSEIGLRPDNVSGAFNGCGE